MIIGSITNALASARLRTLMLRLLGELRTQRGNPAPGHLNCDEQRHRFQRPRNDRPRARPAGNPKRPERVNLRRSKISSGARERNGKSHIRDLSFSASGCIFLD